MKKEIIILGGARDYHAIDWYRAVRKQVQDREVIFLTDMVSAEGYDVLINEKDNICFLYNIDCLLFASQTRLGNVWRNFIKLLVLPLQVINLKRFLINYPDAVIHAHPMYYMLLCWLSRVKYIGTPQGSEILVRPQRSFIYKYFAKKVLRSAQYITVDSISMQEGIDEISGVRPLVVQNGIDMEAIRTASKSEKRTIDVLSIRGMTELYRINHLLDSRDKSKVKIPISFIYPFGEDEYLTKIKNKLLPQDSLIGRLNKTDMYEILGQSKLVISIPKSDSSPRSVYEAIFLGCCVAVTYNRWIDSLPDCMKNRLYIVDLEDELWFEKALKYARKITNSKYVPSSEAVELFDQNVSLKKLIKSIY